MNERMKILLDRVSTWSEEDQEQLIAAAAEIELHRTRMYRLSDEESAAVARGLEEARQGKFATDDEVAAVFNRYRS